MDADDFKLLHENIEKLYLNDSSFSFVQESSSALGMGFRCGFLGLLHLEIIVERLKREFNMDLILTTPTVVYKIILKNGDIIMAENPKDLPEVSLISEFLEPWVTATIFTPKEYVGTIIGLCIERRGIQENIEYLGDRVIMNFSLPLSEIIFDFYGKIKSITSGYASFNWDITDYKPASIVSLNILINSELVDALSCLIHKDRAYKHGKSLCKKLKDIIPRQLFKIAIQAATGNKIIARETIDALRKDVTSKCYGGDITRKKKLLEKQKKGKKRMRSVGNVDLPQEAFVAALKITDE
jgi:GTP-binding protein LepA